MLEVYLLEKTYGRIIAVKSLSFTVNRGEIFGLLGPNGAGKTTTLECILGIKKADAGSVRIFGRDTADLRRTWFEYIGVQFQESHYPDRIRVDELILMTASLYRESNKRLPELLDIFGLTPFLKQPVDKLSGGERQKLSVILALINNPKIVFLDELTTGLDPKARRDVWSFLESLKQNGLTIVLTSHFMDEVTRLCDRILVMKDGAEAVSGTPEQVISRSGTDSMEDAYLYFAGEKGGYDESAFNAV